MFDTWYETQAKMDESKDYKDNEGDNRIYAICKCSGRVPEGEPDCVRNPEKVLAHRGQGWCLWYLPNGSKHCGHRFPPEKPDDSGNP